MKEEPLRNIVILKQILADDLAKRSNMLEAMVRSEKSQLEYEKMKLYYECMELKQKMEMKEAYRSQGGSVSNILVQSVNSVLSNPYNRNLEMMKEKMQEDKAEYERFALKEEEHQKLKSLYRTLLERGLEDEQYFQKARQAYMENDADELKKLTDKEVCVKEDVDHASLLQALEENIQRLLSSFWLSQEDLLLSQEKSYLGPLQEECRYYQQTKDEMTSLYYRAGN